MTSSYYCLLSITPGDILNEIALLYSSSSEAKIRREKYIFVQCSLSETAKEVLNRRRRKRLETIFAASLGVKLNVTAKISNAEFQPRIYIMYFT